MIGAALPAMGMAGAGGGGRVAPRGDSAPRLEAGTATQAAADTQAPALDAADKAGAPAEDAASTDAQDFAGLLVQAPPPPPPPPPPAAPAPAEAPGASADAPSPEHLLALLDGAWSGLRPATAAPADSLASGHAAQALAASPASPVLAASQPTAESLRLDAAPTSARPALAPADAAPLAFAATAEGLHAYPAIASDRLNLTPVDAVSLASATAEGLHDHHVIASKQLSLAPADAAPTGPTPAALVEAAASAREGAPATQPGFALDAGTVAAAAPPPAARSQAAPALPPLPMPADPAAGFDEGFGTRVVWMAEQRLGHAEIRLNPEHVGPIEVRVQLDGEQVRAEFHSANIEVRQAIEASLPRLRELLGQHGLQLGQADVGQGQAGREGGDGRTAAAGRGGNGTGTREETSQDPAPVRVRGLLDEYA